MGGPISIALHPARAADLPILARLDIAANVSHPLISQSFQYPFQASKLWLAHLQHCFNRSGSSGEYRLRVARLSSSQRKQRVGITVVEDEVAKGKRLELERSSSIDSGIGLPLISESGIAEGEEDDGTGEIVGFMMWRVRKRQVQTSGKEGSEEEKGEEWDWISQLPKGTDLKLWKRYVEIMSSDLEIGRGDIEILKLAVLVKYQGCGVGTSLVQSFLNTMELDLSPLDHQDPQKTHARQVPTIRVRASRTAKALYEKLGWTSVKEYTFDLREWGRGRAYVDFEMILEAQAE